MEVGRRAMTTSADVMLWGTRIGTVALFDGERFARFEYAPDFIASGIEVSPLRMPLSGNVFSFPQLNEMSFHGLPGLLADSLPDKFGNAVIDSWLESQGGDPARLTPLSGCATRVLAEWARWSMFPPLDRRQLRRRAFRLTGLLSWLRKFLRGGNR